MFEGFGHGYTQTRIAVRSEMAAIRPMMLAAETDAEVAVKVNECLERIGARLERLTDDIESGVAARAAAA
jgi:hypothetical protein